MNCTSYISRAALGSAMCCQLYWNKTSFSRRPRSVFPVRFGKKKGREQGAVAFGVGFFKLIVLRDTAAIEPDGGTGRRREGCGG